MLAVQRVARFDFGVERHQVCNGPFDDRCDLGRHALEATFLHAVLQVVQQWVHAVQDDIRIDVAIPLAIEVLTGLQSFEAAMPQEMKVRVLILQMRVIFEVPLGIEEVRFMEQFEIANLLLCHEQRAIS
ncbi:hypothetical protein D3C71_1483040 [compost metagenome]